jgi:hypothetical protein
MPRDQETEQRQRQDSGEKLIRAHEIARLQHEGADAFFGPDHFGRMQRRDVGLGRREIGVER